MKNAFKLLGIIALAVIIGFSVTACSHGDDVGGHDPNSGNEDPNDNNGDGVGDDGNNGEDPGDNNGDGTGGDDNNGEDPIDGEDLVYGPGDAPEGLFAQWYLSQEEADEGDADWLFEFKSDGTVIISGEEYLFKVVGDEELYVITAEELRSNPEGGIGHTFTLDGTELTISSETVSSLVGTFYKEAE